MFGFKVTVSFHFLFLLILYFCFAGCGDIASTESSTSNSQDNSVDNSQHGISSCSTGSDLVCRENEDGGVSTFTQTVECVNVNGQPVVLSELEPVDDDINEACPPPAIIVESGELAFTSPPTPQTNNGGLDQQT